MNSAGRYKQNENEREKGNGICREAIIVALFLEGFTYRRVRVLVQINESFFVGHLHVHTQWRSNLRVCFKNHFVAFQFISFSFNFNDAKFSVKSII